MLVMKTLWQSGYEQLQGCQDKTLSLQTDEASPTLQICGNSGAWLYSSYFLWYSWNENFLLIKQEHWMEGQ